MNGSRKSGKIKLPADMLAELDAMDEIKTGGQPKTLTPEQEAILLEYWPRKKQQDIAEWWQAKYGWGSKDTLRKKYEQLVKKKK